MNTAEVVVHVKQGDGVNMVFDLLRKSISQTGESPHVHPHVKILPLHVAGADMPVIRRPDDVNALGAKTLCRAVALLSFRIVAVDLDQLRVVHFRRERIRDGHQIHFVTIGSQLDTVCQTALNILKKRRRTPGIPPSNHPTNHEFRLSFNRRERPNIAADLRIKLPRRDVLLFAANVTLNFIHLNTLGRHVADNPVLVISTSLSDFGEQSEDSSFRNARHADGRANGATFNQRRYHRDPSVYAQLVHESSIPYRFSITRDIGRLGGLFSRFGWNCLGLRFRPASLRRVGCYLTPALIRHGHQATLTADLATLAAQSCHNPRQQCRVLDDAQGFFGFGYFDDVFENAFSGLNHIGAFATSALWHTLSVARPAQICQPGGISN